MPLLQALTAFIIDGLETTLSISMKDFVYMQPIGVLPVCKSIQSVITILID